MKAKKGQIIAIIILSIVALLLIGAILFFTIGGGSAKGRFEKALKLGQKYLEDYDYDNAIAQFELAYEIDPKSEEARDLLHDAYSDYADELIAEENYKKAVKILEKANKTFPDDEFEELLISTYVVYIEECKSEGKETQVEKLIEKYEELTGEEYTETDADADNGDGENKDSGLPGGEGDSEGGTETGTSPKTPDAGSAGNSEPWQYWDSANDGDEDYIEPIQEALNSIDRFLKGQTEAYVSSGYNSDLNYICDTGEYDADYNAIDLFKKYYSGGQSFSINDLDDMVRNSDVMATPNPEKRYSIFRNTNADQWILVLNYNGLNIYDPNDDSYANFFFILDDDGLYLTYAYDSWARNIVSMSENLVIYCISSGGADDTSFIYSVINDEGFIENISESSQYDEQKEVRDFTKWSRR